MEQTVVQDSKVFKVYPDGPPGHGLQPISVMDQANIISGVGTEIGTFDYVDPTRQFMVGIWESTPCVEYIPFYPCDEFCLILKGSIRLTFKDGTEKFYTAGEGFVVLRGTECHYAMAETTRKYSIMFENKLKV